MPWNTLNTYSAEEAVPSAEWNNMVENLSYLKAGRTQLEYDFGNTAWTITADAGVWEADTDATNFKLTLALADTGDFLIVAIIRFKSDEIATFSAKYRIKVTDGTTTWYGPDLDYESELAVDYYRQYVTIAMFEDKAAANYTVTLQGAREDAADTVVAEERFLAAIII